MIEIVTGVEDDNYVVITISNGFNIISNGFKPIGKQKFVFLCFPPKRVKRTDRKTLIIK